MSLATPLRLGPLHQGSQRPPPDQMQVQVVDLLAAVGIAVDDQSVTALGNGMLAREVARDDNHMSEQRLVIVFDVVRRRDDLVWDDQDMYRCDGSNGQKRDDARMPVENLGRQLAGNDLFEKR